MTTTTLELEAIKVLAERGWARYDSAYDSDEPCCIGGALYAASFRGENFNYSDYPGYDEIRKYVAQAIRERYPDRVRDKDSDGIVVFTFNDSIAEDVDDVIDVLRATAELRNGDQA